MLPRCDTLTTVSTAEQRVAVISLDVFRIVEATGAPLTERLVRERIDELAGHRRMPGAAAAVRAATRVSAYRVLKQVARWRESIATADVRGAIWPTGRVSQCPRMTFICGNDSGRVPEVDAAGPPSGPRSRTVTNRSRYGS